VSASFNQTFQGGAKTPQFIRIGSDVVPVRLRWPAEQAKRRRARVSIKHLQSWSTTTIEMKRPAGRCWKASCWLCVSKDLRRARAGVFGGEARWNVIAPRHPGIEPNGDTTGAGRLLFGRDVLPELQRHGCLSSSTTNPECGKYTAPEYWLNFE